MLTSASAFVQPLALNKVTYRAPALEAVRNDGTCKNGKSLMKN